MRAFLAVTDLEWTQQLSLSGPELPQANFWRPGGGRPFRVLDSGELFLFKTRERDGNQIVGGGIYDAFLPMRIVDSWELFGLQNGVTDLESFGERVRRYRRSNEPLDLTSMIGCILIRDVRFFSRIERLTAPSDFQKNIVQGRTYQLDELPSDHEVVRAAAALAMPGTLPMEAPVPWELRQRMFGDARLVPRRLGQQAFKAVVAANYQHRCAVTGDKVRPVLEAAHIRPVAHGGMHRSDNGMLLRSDIHTLFDRGYVGVDTKHRLRVSRRLRTEFGNGDALYAMEGTEIALPERRADRPNVEFLEWHMDTVFRSSA